MLKKKNNLCFRNSFFLSSYDRIENELHRTLFEIVPHGFLFNCLLLSWRFLNSLKENQQTQKYSYSIMLELMTDYSLLNVFVENISL